jgi:hypothetical protein
MGVAICRLHAQSAECPRQLGICRRATASESSAGREKHQFPPLRRCSVVQETTEGPKAATCDAAALIETLQPFNKGADAPKDALLALHTLNKLDKHRLPQIVLMSVRQQNPVAHLEFASDADASAALPPEWDGNTGTIEPGGVLHEVRVKRPISNLSGTITCEAVPAVQTSVGLEGLLPLTETLGSSVVYVLKRFRALDSVSLASKV